MWAYAILAGAQLIGGYQQADAINNGAKVQQSISDMNARFADLDAFNANKAAGGKAARYQSMVDATVAKQRSTLASQKVDVNYGTAADVQTESKLTGNLNVLEIQRQGADQARGYQMQAINTRLGGQMGLLQASMDASAAVNRGVTGALSTGISGYQQAQSTGTGLGSKSGTNSTPQWGGGGSTTPGSFENPAASPKEAWFFGPNPSPHSQPTNSSLYSDSDWKF